jgi:hypothetical protein
VQPSTLARLRLTFTAAVTVAIWSLLLWEHFHGGVPRHHLLAREDLPAVSNGWGALFLPLLAWFLSGRIVRRLSRPTGGSPRGVTLAFGFAVAYGATLAVAFSTDNGHISSLLFRALPIVAVVVPIHRAEYVLGFVLGLTYSFGAILPTLIAGVMAGISALLHLVVWPLLGRLVRFVRKPGARGT